MLTDLSHSKDLLRSAGLHYILDSAPGIRRLGRAGRFRYVSPSGKTVRSSEVLKRIRKLAIPPAYHDVWIASDPRAHLQAVGKDDRGRKQYRYHPKWVEIRDETKFHKMIEFGEALPKIRRQTERDLTLPGMPKNKVIAAVVQLLERTFIRIGNSEYAQQNHSYGLTTFRNHHVKVKGNHLHFHFRGKRGIEHAIDLEDSRIAKIIRNCQELPGQELFEYVDSEGNTHKISSEDVNQYLKEIMGGDFTAKDFRTWAGTILAVSALCGFPNFSSISECKRNMNTAISQVAKHLGNTKAVCKRSYIHPEVLEAYQRAELMKAFPKVLAKLPRGRFQLSSFERQILRFLKEMELRASTPMSSLLHASLKALKRKNKKNRTSI